MDACTRRLKAGCRQINLPAATAKELLRFLLVRKLAADERGIRLGLSSKLERLLRWLLLETELLHQVEQLCGKVHYKHIKEDKSSEDYMMRRLRSLEEFAHVGWQPDLSLWEEEGTLLTNIKPVVLGTEEQDVTLYICAGRGVSLADFDNRELELTKVSHDEEAENHHSSKRQRLCSGVKDQDAAPASNNATSASMQIFVQGMTGEMHALDMYAESTVEDFKKAICLKTGVPIDKQRLIFGGYQLETGRTLRHYNIQKESTVHLVLKLTGC